MIQLCIQQFISLIGSVSQTFFCVIWRTHILQTLSYQRNAGTGNLESNLPKDRISKPSLVLCYEQVFMGPECRSSNLIAKFSFIYIWNSVPRGTQSKSKLWIQTLLLGEFRSFVCTAIQITEHILPGIYAQTCRHLLAGLILLLCYCTIVSRWSKVKSNFEMKLFHGRFNKFLILCLPSDIKQQFECQTA